eukprot:gene13826-4045_t
MKNSAHSEESDSLSKDRCRNTGLQATTCKITEKYFTSADTGNQDYLVRPTTSAFYRQHIAETFDQVKDKAMEKVKNMNEKAKQRARQLTDKARDGAKQLKDKAIDRTKQSREKVGE